MDWTAASVLVSAFSVVVTIVIALRSVNKELRHNRFLQERDIAIRLLHENEFEPEWLAAQRAFFSKLLYAPTFDWQAFSINKFSPADKLSPEEKQFGYQATMVLNRMELISVAILTGVANESIIEAHIRIQLILAFEQAQPYIKEARRINNDQNVYCNLEKVAGKWKGEQNIAERQEAPEA